MVCRTSGLYGLQELCLTQSVQLDIAWVMLEGAFGLDGSLLTGRTLLNLDTEDWGEIFIGCAGKSSFRICVPSGRNKASSAHCSCLSAFDIQLQIGYAPSGCLQTISLVSSCCLAVLIGEAC